MHLFWSFTLLALQGFGGVLAVVQREIVERRQWLTREEFLEDWAVAQILPGPNVVNLSLMIGGRHFGWRGALAGLAGMLCVPTLVVITLAVAYASVATHPVAQGALRGMGAASGGLIAATGLRLMPALKGNAMGLGICALVGGLTLMAVAVLRWPLLWVVLGIGGAACAYAGHRLQHVPPKAGTR